MFDATPDRAAENSPSIDPTIRVCERHLRILEEVGEIALEVTRASGETAVAGARAAAQIVSPAEGWCSEIDKARAFAASKDSAASFQKAARALRLTLAPEKAIAMTGRKSAAISASYPKNLSDAPTLGPAQWAALHLPGAGFPPARDLPRTCLNLPGTCRNLPGRLP